MRTFAKRPHINNFNIKTIRKLWSKLWQKVSYSYSFYLICALTTTKHLILINKWFNNYLRLGSDWHKYKEPRSPSIGFKAQLAPAKFLGHSIELTKLSWNIEKNLWVRGLDFSLENVKVEKIKTGLLQYDTIFLTKSTMLNRMVKVRSV